MGATESVEFLLAKTCIDCRYQERNPPNCISGEDVNVGFRQKNKVGSWRPLGSRALSLLKVAELNGQWEQLWFPAQAA